MVPTPWRCGGHTLNFDQPRIMGILNITPDSFSDGGKLYQHDKPALSTVVEIAQQMIDDGADVLDIGGESTRPGAEPVPVEEELRRVLPVVSALAGCGALLSVDTRHTAVAAAAVDAGAHVINDVSAGADAGMLDLVAQSDVGYALMHMQGDPRTMQQSPHYVDVVAEVAAYLQQRVDACVEAGVDIDRICIDPGIGFGKSFDHNIDLLRSLEALRVARRPMLVGVSRKRMLGTITGREVEQRMVASVTAAVLAAQGGANILRVHDVAPTRDGLAVLEAMRSSNSG